MRSLDDGWIRTPLFRAPSLRGGKEAQVDAESRHFFAEKLAEENLGEALRSARGHANADQPLYKYHSRVMGSLRAPQVLPDELSFSASRSGGPGGQNVNKVATRVTATFNARESPALTPDQRARIESRLRHRISKDGNLQTVSQTYRSQARNRTDAMERMQALIDSAFVVRRRRRKTKPTQASVRRRLEAKSRRSLAKRLRRRPHEDR